MIYEAGYKKLNVYLQAHELVIMVYQLTKKFPRDELFGLVSQMRRCAVSVPANIVEGYGRRTNKDKVHFYYISRGSLNELEYYIDLSFNLGYLDKEAYNNLFSLRDDCGRLLNGFIKSIK
ncbi:MAG: four helix bundle protein [bacterium]|nr:four helix bundle protein [bacterium]